MAFYGPEIPLPAAFPNPSQPIETQNLLSFGGSVSGLKSGFSLPSGKCDRIN